MKQNPFHKAGIIRRSTKQIARHNSPPSQEPDSLGRSISRDEQITPVTGQQYMYAVQKIYKWRGGEIENACQQISRSHRLQQPSEDFIQIFYRCFREMAATWEQNKDKRLRQCIWIPNYTAVWAATCGVRHEGINTLLLRAILEIVKHEAFFFQLIACSMEASTCLHWGYSETRKLFEAQHQKNEKMLTWRTYLVCHSQAILVSKLLRQIANAWNADNGYR